MKIVARAIRTEYWKPGDNYREIILESISKKSQDGDILAISEKALAVARGRIVDESKSKPGPLARTLADFWMRLIWGFVLGRLCHLKPTNINHLRKYPASEGARHKQVCLEYSGLFQALRPFSEGGIDTTNLPFSLASLPLESPRRLAEEIRVAISGKLGRDIIVAIVDSDKTYSRCGVHFASRSTDIPGIVDLGFFAYLIGRAFRWTARSTPLAWAGSHVTSEYALRVAGLANKARGCGAGKTAWDMATRFGVGLTQVNWDMLEQVEHRPLVILRPRSAEQQVVLGPVSAQQQNR
jgi:F420-0:gamma-glutamyl ligase-like protein